jgi:transcriptional regulator with XRE-family HTH domain
MATSEKARDRGRRRGQEAVAALCREIRLARRSIGLSLAAVAHEVDISVATLSRIERGLVPAVSLTLLAQLCEVVGLELSAKAYPGGRPLRDARQAGQLEKLRAMIHASLRWRTEVPLPIQGDKRAWDGGIFGPGWFYGVEAEMNPIDGQQVCRRIQLKLRDSRASGVILLMPDTRQTRRFRREFAGLLAQDYPVPGKRARELLAAGVAPGGSAIVIL